MTDDLMLMAYVDNELNLEGRRLIERRIRQEPALKARLSRLQQSAQLTRLSTVAFASEPLDPRTVGLMHVATPRRARMRLTRDQALLGAVLLLLGIVIGMILVTLFTKVSLSSPIDHEVSRLMSGSRR